MSILKHAQRFIVPAVVATLILTGCSLGSSAEAPADSEVKNEVAAGSPDLAVESAAEEVAAVRVTESEEAKELALPTAPTPAEKAATTGEAEMGYSAGSEGSAEMADDAAAPEPMPAESIDADMAEMDTGFAEESRSEVAMPQQVEPLRAGEVNDNAEWDDYLLYRRNYVGPYVNDRNISERYIVEVTDGQGYPVLGAQVSFFLPGQQQGEEIYSARTMANGQVLFHPLSLDEQLAQVNRFQVEIESNGVTQQFPLTRFNAQAGNSFTEKWTVALDARQQQVDTLNLDVLFLIDATGSMADEIAKVQNTIFDVAAQIDALPENPNVRYGLVSYRDRTDSYITEAYEFTPDVREFSRNLNTVSANGGDDYPESLNEGLHDALHSVEWRGGNTVQLVFLVADAPPHLDYAQDYDYSEEMQIAAERGIKIHTIASSGLDDQGEYIFRQIAQYTQGRFIFLTYEDDSNGGAPGDTTTHHVEDYSVDNLDNLLVKLVREELSFQNPQYVQAQQ